MAPDFIRLESNIKCTPSVKDRVDEVPLANDLLAA
jgi:hypothetical protein